jgi:hypothetical protein
MKPIVGKGGESGSGGDDPPPKHAPIPPKPNPTPTPPAPPPLGANSARAADGSTITWSTAPDGTLTMKGSNGASLVQGAVPGRPILNTLRTQTVYAQAGTPYLTVTYSISLTRRQFSIHWATSNVTLTLGLAIPADDGSGPSAAVLGGTANGTRVSWRGTVTPGAFGDPRALAGWPKGALDAELAKVAYFAPALQALTATRPPLAKATTGGKSNAPHPQDDSPWWKGAVAAAAFYLKSLVPAAQGNTFTLLFTIDVAFITYDVGLLTDGLPNSMTVTPGSFTPDEPDPQAADAGAPMGIPDDDGNVDGGGGGDGGGCFVGTTLVRIVDGHVPIAQIAVGDAVVAYDVKRNEHVTRPIDKTWALAKPELCVLGFAGEEIRCTPPHRFYVQPGIWRPAGELVVGDSVLTSSGDWEVVRSIGRESGEQQVYNLSVEQIHTYLVGRTELVVHNVKTNGDGGDDGGTDDDDE